LQLRETTSSRESADPVSRVGRSSLQPTPPGGKMRRFLLVPLLLIVTLFAAACSDQPSQLPAEPTLSPHESTGELSDCSLLGVLAQIVYLVPKKTLLDAIKARLSQIPSPVTSRNRKTAQEKALIVVDLILEAYYGGQLRPLPPDQLQARVVRLINSIYCLVRLPAPPLSAGDLGEDGVVEVVGPTTDKAVTTPNGQAGVDINPGDVPILTTIIISRLPDFPPPLNTNLRQFPPFYHFSSNPEVEFTSAVVTGICVEDPGVSLLLAHNVGEGIEILPPATPTFLDCDEFDEIGAADEGATRALAWAKLLLLPAELHASAALAKTGVGGTTRKFSPFGAVEEGFDYGSTGYRYLLLEPPAGSPPEGFADPGFSDEGFSTGDAGFGFNNPANSCALIIANTETPWPPGVSETNTSQILLRKFFGTSSSVVRVRVAIDNDIRVFVDGEEITASGGTPVEGFIRHEGCPTENSFTFTASGLDPSVEHLLAIQARDRGGSTYVDAQVQPLATD
jgi:hypothetical protein